TITVAEPGRAFAFTVSYLRLPVATWRYELHADKRGGTVLTESVEDHRGALLRTVSPFITESRNRSERNDATMRTTLDRLKAAAESSRWAGPSPSSPTRFHPALAPSQVRDSP